MIINLYKRGANLQKESYCYDQPVPNLLLAVKSPHDNHIMNKAHLKLYVFLFKCLHLFLYIFKKSPTYNVPEVIDFPRYNMICIGENVILCEIFHVVSRFPLLFMLYRGNLDYFLDSVKCFKKGLQNVQRRHLT